MPHALTVQGVNDALGTAGVEGLLADPGDILERLSVPGGLIDVAEALLDLDDAQIEYLQSVPTVLQEAIRGALAEALNQGKAVQLQYSPGYDFEVRLWDYGQAVSVHLSGPYATNEAKAAYLGAT